MKKLIVMLLLALTSICMSDPNDVLIPDANDVFSLSFRLLTEPTLGRTNLEGWLGFRKDDSEVGFIGGYIDESTDKDSSMTLGGFSMFHFPDVRPIIENILWPSEWIPQEIVAEPAAGLAVVYNLDEHILKVSPFIAMRIYKTMELQFAYDTYGSNTEQSDGMRIGLSTSWKF